MEGTVIAERAEIELQGLRLDEPSLRNIVDDEMSEVGLTSHRAKRGEFWRGEARDVSRVGMRIGHTLEHRRFGARRQVGMGAELRHVWRPFSHFGSLKPAPSSRAVRHAG